MEDDQGSLDYFHFPALARSLLSVATSGRHEIRNAIEAYGRIPLSSDQNEKEKLPETRPNEYALLLLT